MEIGKKKKTKTNGRQRSQVKDPRESEELAILGLVFKLYLR